MATLPRVVSGPPMSGGCLSAQDQASGGQIGGGFVHGNQDGPRCNDTLRKQASPRSNTLGGGSAGTGGQGKAWCDCKFADTEWNNNVLNKCETDGE